MEFSLADRKILPVSRNKNIMELKQPRRPRQQERHKVEDVTMKNNSFACFTRAFFIFKHFADLLVVSTT